MKHKTKFVALACAGLVFWLWRDIRETQERVREEHRLHCLDDICADDYPIHDLKKEAVVKLNGHWYIGPSDYFRSGFGYTKFYWPSRRPAFIGGINPDKSSSDPYDKMIEIFLRSREPYSPSRWYEISQQEEAEGRLISKITPREGLEIRRIREESHIVVEYIATNFRNEYENGTPPVLGCWDPPKPDDTCTTAFFWKPKIEVYIRFYAKHAKDWPEIYQEAMRVLQLLRRI